MPKTSYAATRAPQKADRPKATLPQLGELVGQMDKGLVDRDYMQDFLRRRLVRLGQVVSVQPPTPNALLADIEEIAREHYPHAVNEILEIVGPFCDPQLDFEFQPFVKDRDWGKVSEALFWLPVKNVEVVSIYPHSGEESARAAIGRHGLKGESLSNRIYKDMFADVFATYGHLNTVSSKGADQIINGSESARRSLYGHVHNRFDADGAVKYGLIGNSHMWEGGGGVVGSILGAISKAILFAATGDRVRLGKVVGFLTYQRCGRPIFFWQDETAYVFALSSK